MSRADLLQQVAGMIPVTTDGYGVRVAVDGVDGVGKTTFADELAAVVRDLGRPVLRVGVDAFHRPQSQRYRRGRESPIGFWLDAFDYPALRSGVLDPMGADGDGRFRTAVHDLASDRPLDLDRQQAVPGAVMIIDGLFLHRDELNQSWDFSIFLAAPFEVTVARMAERDGAPPDQDDPRVLRYVGGQRLYFSACSPWQRASLVIDNSDLDEPRIVTQRAGE